MRYPISGVATQAIPPNTSTGATGVTTLLSITSGRTFWLRGLYIARQATEGPVEIYDATAQTTATGQTLKLSIPVATGYSALDVARTIEFASPGVKFSNNYILARMSASGSIGIGQLAVFGTEE